MTQLIAASTNNSNLFSLQAARTDDSNVDIDIFLSPAHSPSVARELIETARALVTPRGRGIYASDEAPDAIAVVLQDKHRQWSPEEHRDRRKRWRHSAYGALSNGEVLFVYITSSSHLRSSEYISGVILHPETLQDRDLGFAPLLLAKGIIPGVRANGELRPLPSSPREADFVVQGAREFIVQGLDGLLEQLQAARTAGARFSKWRVPIACTSVVGGLPTRASLEAQAETLAQYAAISQQAGLVPIVEPDVEFSEDADLVRSVEVHEQAIAMIYARCRAYGVLLEGVIPMW